MAKTVFYYFVALLVIIDPIGTAAAFIALMRGVNPEYGRRIALRGVVIAGIVLLAFAVAGDLVLEALGVGLPAFRLAGGCLLFLIAIDMLLAGQPGFRQLTESENREAGGSYDISVFPLAIPLIAGPGALTTIVLLMEHAEGNPLESAWLVVVTAAVLALTLISLLFAARIVAFLGATGVNVVHRVFGILLAALAAQLILDGIAGGLRLG